jgi:hypothetical protein
METERKNELEPTPTNISSSFSINITMNIMPRHSRFRGSIDQIHKGFFQMMKINVFGIVIIFARKFCDQMTLVHQRMSWVIISTKTQINSSNERMLLINHYNLLMVRPIQFCTTSWMAQHSNIWMQRLISMQTIFSEIPHVSVLL